MPASYRTVHEHEADIAFGETEAFALDVLVGLTEKRKEIPSKYLYACDVYNSSIAYWSMGL